MNHLQRQCEKRIQELQTSFQTFSDEYSDSLSSSNIILLRMLRSIQTRTSKLDIVCEEFVESVHPPSVRNARAYMTVCDYPRVILFPSELKTIRSIDETLRHELTHVDDYLQGKHDLSTCSGLAFSEIKAARNAECFRYRFFPWIQDACITGIATSATKNVFPEEGEECVKRMFNIAKKDIS